MNGKDLIAAGYDPAPWFGDLIREARDRDLSREGGFRLAARMHADWLDAQPARMNLQDPMDVPVNITAETEFERENVAAVLESFRELTRTPTVVAGAVMPDACPAGPVGTIPVGGVIGARGAIHPGMHSADICCSMFVTVLDETDPDRVLEAAAGVTHFGPGGRQDGRFTLDAGLDARMAENAFLNGDKIRAAARSHLGTQGDGNHFFYVGQTGDGRVAMVTHHGSRGVGGQLYKAGMRVAEAHRQKVAPDVLKGNAWIPLDSAEGESYWDALQILRDWTKENHRVLHDAVAGEIGARVDDRLWNEHNFVFREDDLIWHAKGATPVHDGFLPDNAGVQIVPLNMREPVLLIRGERTSGNLGFAPHGAGRNMSRTRHKRTLEGLTDQEVFERETDGVDARFHCARIDVSELPSAYKNAASVRADMERFGLCEVVAEIKPHGCIMAGDWEADAPWKRPRKPVASEPDNTPPEP